MIPPALAATAATTALGALSSLAPDAPAERNNVIGQQDFLTLLVAQLQNQDPLAPLDSANFSAQLAQFSSLEQLMQINQRLAALGSDAGSGLLDPVAFLGREVTAAGGTVAVKDGAASVLEYTLDAAGAVALEVRDASGDVVARTTLGELGAGRHELDLGSVPGVPQLADGSYVVRLTLTPQGGGEPVEVETRLRGTVTGVDLTQNPPILLIGDIEVRLGDVRQVRDVAAVA